MYIEMSFNKYFDNIKGYLLKFENYFNLIQLLTQKRELFVELPVPWKIYVKYFKYNR